MPDKMYAEEAQHLNDLCCVWLGYKIDAHTVEISRVSALRKGQRLGSSGYSKHGQTVSLKLIVSPSKQSCES